MYSTPRAELAIQFDKATLALPAAVMRDQILGKGDHHKEEMP